MDERAMNDLVGNLTPDQTKILLGLVIDNMEVEAIADVLAGHLEEHQLQELSEILVPE